MADTQEKYMVSRRERKYLFIAIILLLATGGLLWGIYSLLFNTEKDEVPKGRLHMDNVEDSKYVYVENYSDSKTGCDIYVRVRLNEYFEYGQGASDGSGKKTTIVRSGILNSNKPNRSDHSTWDIFDYYEDSADEVIDIRHFITLKLGGQTVYMPTFNKNYNSNEIDEQNLNKAYKNTQIISKAVMYPDLFNQGEVKFDKIEEHEARETLMGRVITMSKWKELGYPVDADLWVFDTDGWAYWAAPLKADTATGVLLNKVVVEYDINSDWYYEVVPELEYTTKENFVGMEYKTPEAVILLDKISGGDVEQG